MATKSSTPANPPVSSAKGKPSKKATKKLVKKTPAKAQVTPTQVVQPVAPVNAPLGIMRALAGYEIIVSDLGTPRNVTVTGSNPLDLSKYSRDAVEASLSKGDLRRMLDLGHLYEDTSTPGASAPLRENTPLPAAKLLLSHDSSKDREREVIFKAFENRVPQERIAERYNVSRAYVAELFAEYNVRPDDLMAIPSINAPRQRQLFNLGIRTFAQLGAQNPETLSSRLGGFVQAGVCRDWITSAKQLSGKKGEDVALSLTTEG